MTKYKEYFDKMLKENKEAFNAFTLLHGNYENDEDKYQNEFNKEGEKSNGKSSTFPHKE